MNSRKKKSFSGCLRTTALSCGIFLLTLSALFWKPVCAAAPEPPLADLYLKIVVEGVRRALEYQSADGRYNLSAEMKNKAQARVNLYDQMANYPVAYLYRTRHPLNPYFGDRRLLQAALANGDFLLKYESETVWPLNNWTLYTWIEAFDLLKDFLGAERKAAWTERIQYWLHYYLEYVERSRGKRQYTALQLGVSPNHYSLFMASIFRAGQVFGHPEWVKLATTEMKNLLRTQHPDGFWAEHDGPVNSYHRVTTHGVGLYYAFTGDPEALEALRRAKDFTLNFTYPDGSAVAVIDERNRYSSEIRADWGLLGLSHFPDGRRYNRLVTRLALDKLGLSGPDDRKGNPATDYDLSFMGLAWILDNLKYSEVGPESPAPQELERYEARLMSGAVLLRRGDWVVTLAGIISPPWEGNRFFLDRYTYLEVWHTKSGLLIGGGNTKRQPQIAGLLMEPSHSGLDFWPRESRILVNGDTLCLELSFEKFRARQKVAILDALTLGMAVEFSETTPSILWPNRYECNLQLQLKDSQTLSYGGGQSAALGEKKINLLEEQVGPALETALWKLEVPNGRTSLRFPFLPFFNYDIDGIGGPGGAVGILSSFTDDPRKTFEYVLRMK